MPALFRGIRKLPLLPTAQKPNDKPDTRLLLEDLVLQRVFLVSPLVVGLIDHVALDVLAIRLHFLLRYLLVQVLVFLRVEYRVLLPPLQGLFLLTQLHVLVILHYSHILLIPQVQ